MRLIPFFAAAFVLLVPGLGVAQPPKPQPLAAGGTTPGMGIADGIKNGRLLFRQGVNSIAMRQVPVTKTKRIVVNGERRDISVTEYQSVIETMPMPVDSFPLEQIQAFDTEGRSISRERLESILSKPAIVLFALEGTTVDPGFLKVVRPGTPFLVIPVVGATGGSAPVAPTAPAAAPAPVLAPAPGTE